MTDTQGAVYDLGYEPYDGERLGRSGARRTVFWDGIRRVLGIRRKARRKVLPWTLIVIAVIPAIVVVGIGFFVVNCRKSKFRNETVVRNEIVAVAVAVDVKLESIVKKIC